MVGTDSSLDGPKRPGYRYVQRRTTDRQSLEQGLDIASFWPPRFEVVVA